MNEQDYKLKLVEHNEILNGIINKVKSKSLSYQSHSIYTSYFQILVGLILMVLLIYLINCGGNGNNSEGIVEDNVSCHNGFCFRTL